MIEKIPKVIRFATEKDEPINIRDQVWVLIEFFKQAVNIPLEIVYPEPNEIGTRLQNGTWTGLFGMMQNDEADITYNLIATEEETEVIDFSAAYAYDEVTFITRKPTKEHGFFAFIRPFSVFLWIGVVILYVFMSLLFYKFLREKRSFSDLLIEMFGSFLHQPYDFNSRRNSKRLLFLSWMLGVLFITSSYTATLLSFLMIPSLSGVRTIEELAKAVKTEKYICRTHPNHIIIKMFRESADENMRIIGQSMLENDGKEVDVEKFLDKHKTAFIRGRRVLNLYKNKYHVSKDSFLSLGAYFGFQKKFCCKSLANKVVMRIFETGIYDKFWHRNDYSVSENNYTSIIEESNDVSPLHLKDVEEVFYLLLLGYILSILVFIGEKQMYKKSKLLDRKVKQKFPNRLQKIIHKKRRLKYGKFKRKSHQSLRNKSNKISKKKLKIIKT